MNYSVLTVGAFGEVERIPREFQCHPGLMKIRLVSGSHFQSF